jgi:hypothetical protein
MAYNGMARALLTHGVHGNSQDLAPLFSRSRNGKPWASTSVKALACVRIGHWDKPDQASSFGLTIRSKDSRPCFNLLEEGLANSDRPPAVPHSWPDGLIAHQVRLELRGCGKLLRHLQIAGVKGQNALPVDLYCE